MPTDGRAVVTDAFENVQNVSQETWIVHRFAEFDETEMSWTLCPLFLACLALEVEFELAETRIVEGARHLGAVLRGRARDFEDRHVSDRFLAQDAELDVFDGARGDAHRPHAA